MADELWNTLLRFHREVAAPSIIEPLREEIAAFRRETLSHFDAVYKRLDRLENEYQALRAAVERLEERMTAVEQKLDRMALRSELRELETKVATLQERISQLESEI
jgi:predicted  nucleic acid-binding Zn-ribbon protein